MVFFFAFSRLVFILTQKCSRFLGRESLSSRYARMDTDACGDFTLMHKDHWMSIRGYIELEAYSIHIDSLLLYYALALEIEQYIFPSKLVFTTYLIQVAGSFKILRKNYFGIYVNPNWIGVQQTVLAVIL